MSIWVVGLVVKFMIISFGRDGSVSYSVELLTNWLNSLTLYNYYYYIVDIKWTYLLDFRFISDLLLSAVLVYTFELAIFKPVIR